MDAKRIAKDFGRIMAAGTVAHSLDVEAGLTHSAVYPHPVRLEPVFHAFDPLQTFTTARRPSATRASAPAEWVVQRIILPIAEEVDWRRAEAFLGSIAGVTTPMSVEIIGRRTRAAFHLGAPPDAIGFLADAWLSTYPESAVVASPDPWDDINPAQLVLCDLCSARPYQCAVHTGQAVTPLRHLLRLCASLDEDDVLFYQIVLAPAVHPWQQNIAAALDAERSLGHRAPLGRTAIPKHLAEPLFAAIVRLGATTPRLATSLQAFAGHYSADGIPFSYRTIDDFLRVLTFTQVVAMLRERTSHTTGQLFTTKELARFVHVPDQASAACVPLDVVDGLPVPEALCKPGLPLGTNTTRGMPVHVYQPTRQSNKCEWTIGASGSGKSNSVVHKVLWHAQQGHGVALIDPHRTTTRDVLCTLGDIDPARVMFLDFDAALPVAFNPFDHPLADERGRLAGECGNSFMHLLGTANFHRLNHILTNSLYALFTLKENLAVLPTLLARTPAGEALRRRVIATAQHDAVRRFFAEEYPTHSPEAFAPISNRVSPLLLDERTYRTFSQRENRIHLASAMDTGQIVLIEPPANIDAASIVGGIVIQQFLHAAFRRAGTPGAQAHFYLYIDEFHRFITSSKTLQQIIDEARKGGLSVSLVNQETGQIPTELLNAMYSIPNIFVFGINLPDAKALAPLFNGHVTPHALASQPTGSVYARIGRDIVNFHCPPPVAQSSAAVAEEIIEYSRATYYATAQAAVRESNSSRTARVIEDLT